MTLMTDNALTPAELAALATHGWKADGGYTANGVLLLFFRREGHTRVMAAADWRAELKRTEERDDG